ncbi:unnamed protein product, partial [Aphanomyces euteiches]
EVSTAPRSVTLEIASKAWRLHWSSSNMMSGIAEAGIRPLSREQMHMRLSWYACGGVPATFSMPDWLAAQESISQTIMTAPDASKRPPKRKKIRIGGRILDLTLLGELAECQQQDTRRSGERPSKFGNEDHCENERWRSNSGDRAFPVIWLAEHVIGLEFRRA